MGIGSRRTKKQTVSDDLAVTRGPGTEWYVRQLHIAAELNGFPPPLPFMWGTQAREMVGKSYEQ